MHVFSRKQPGWAGSEKQTAKRKDDRERVRPRAGISARENTASGPMRTKRGAIQRCVALMHAQHHMPVRRQASDRKSVHSGALCALGLARNTMLQ